VLAGVVGDGKFGVSLWIDGIGNSDWKLFTLSEKDEVRSGE
jgi:hypothetical protein